MEQVKVEDPKLEHDERNVFKCFVQGVDKWMDGKKLEKQLQEWKIPFRKTKKVPGVEFATITFAVHQPYLKLRMRPSELVAWPLSENKNRVRVIHSEQTSTKEEEVRKEPKNRRR